MLGWMKWIKELQCSKPLTVVAARRYQYLVLRIELPIVLFIFIHIYLLCPQYLCDCDCAGLFVNAVNGTSQNLTMIEEGLY